MSMKAKLIDDVGNEYSIIITQDMLRFYEWLCKKEIYPKDSDLEIVSTDEYEKI